MKVLFATAELRPLVSAGGLGEAAAGLAAGLRACGVDVITALPDYQGWSLDDASEVALDTPGWAAPARATLGSHADAGALALIDVPDIARPDPYVDSTGEGWPDNDARFARFSAAVAALAEHLDVDLVHLNDWHTAVAIPFLPHDMPALLTIHNLQHQGWLGPEWVDRLPRLQDEYTFGDSINALGGAIRTAHTVVTVSPTYAREIVTPEGGMGLDAPLASRGADLIGIRNGIDTRAWNPARDQHAPRFTAARRAGKKKARAALLEHVGWDDTPDPLIVMVTRLVEQKGVDLAFEAARFLDGMGVRMIVLGSGEQRLADWGRWLMSTQPQRFWFLDGYDAPLSHLLFAGGDALLMPSRFEPCGLAQMQAMAYGTIPIVTPVGGLVDTVVDIDRHPDGGNGIVSATMDESGIVDAVHRGIRLLADRNRLREAQGRGMTTDWSWAEPAAAFVDVFDSMISSD